MTTDQGIIKTETGKLEGIERLEGPPRIVLSMRFTLRNGQTAQYLTRITVWPDNEEAWDRAKKLLESGKRPELQVSYGEKPSPNGRGKYRDVMAIDRPGEAPEPRGNERMAQVYREAAQNTPAASGQPQRSREEDIRLGALGHDAAALIAAYIQHHGKEPDETEEANIIVAWLSMRRKMFDAGG